MEPIWVAELGALPPLDRALLLTHMLTMVVLGGWIVIAELGRSLEIGIRKRLDRQAYAELRTRRAMAFRNAQAHEAMVVGVFSFV
jgi:hypothetical protein